MRLEGKVAVITGGTGGIGGEIARRYLREGAAVVRAARRDPATDRDAQALAERDVFFPVDVADADSTARLMAFTADRFGGIDILVTSAGISRPGFIRSLAPTSWAETFSTNVAGTFLCVQAAIPYLEKSAAPRIITLSSALSSRIAPGAAAYAAAKAAVEALTRACAIELADSFILVNCLCPGFIDSGMGRELAANDRVWASYQPKLALGRLGSGDEVAAVAVFLASTESSYVNGHIFEVNGGLNW